MSHPPGTVGGMHRRYRHPLRTAASISLDEETDPFANPIEAYVHNLLLSLSAREPARGATLRSLGGTDMVLHTMISLAPKKLRSEVASGVADPVTVKKMLARYAESSGGQPRAIPEPAAPVKRNLGFLETLFQLGPTDLAVLTLLCAAEMSSHFREVLDSFGDVTLASAARLLGRALGLTEAALLDAIRPDGRMGRSGLLLVDAAPCVLTGKLSLRIGLVDLVGLSTLREEEIFSKFVPPAKSATLELEDFAALRPKIDLAKAVLAAALEARRPGVNVLFHGATGTGKTELASLLAREIGVPLYSVGNERTEREGTSKTLQRLAALRMANQLVGRSRSLLLFDEIEDLFRWDESPFRMRAPVASDMSKQWFNEMLERNPAPTIWVTNRVEGIDPAFLRRFGYVIELRPPGASQRAKVLSRHLGPDSGIAPADVERIAQRFDASPAQLGTAVAMARLARGGAPDASTIERILEPVHEIVTGTRAPRERGFDGSTYRLDALNAADDLGAVVDRVSEWRPDGRPGLSMCLYGPPGTGKSEFARFLAFKMERRVVYRRVSDIQSMWLGEAERRIAESFREAQEEDALLLFDEVDSFLRSRGGAVRSWEVSQVNEFLSQLESFPGVVVCTTNLWREIDEAALRRFVFKVEFGYPTAEQSWLLFESMLLPSLEPGTAAEVAAARTRLAALAQLAPGDVSVVARRIRALGKAPRVEDAVRQLELEVRQKRGAPARMGFG